MKAGQRIAFVDLPFHRKTRSSQFFIDILSNDFLVDTFFIDTDPRAQIQEISNAAYDVIVCWQTEFCAPYFLLAGQRVVCVPMYDSVSGAPDWYWAPMRQARFLNFSRTLHFRFLKLGLETIYVQYQNPPVSDEKLANFQQLRGFFWQRRPLEGLDYRFARKVLDSAVMSLHIHNAPDEGSVDDYWPDPGCSVSVFSDSAEEFEKALSAANVFLCPRRTEGIGLAMLEALSRGMCVIAHDDATANEYIIDGVNGILIDFDKPVAIALDAFAAERLGEKARAAALVRLSEWQEFHRSFAVLRRHHSCA